MTEQPEARPCPQTRTHPAHRYMLGRLVHQCPGTAEPHAHPYASLDPDDGPATITAGSVDDYPAAEQPVRYTADTITDNALDQLYAEREQLLAELDGRSDEARERWVQKQLNETGLKSMDFRNGMTMDIEPARDMVAQWVGAARAMLGDAPNYTETPIEMVVKVAEAPEQFAFTLQRVGKLTPHQARQQAEQRAEQAEAHLAQAKRNQLGDFETISYWTSQAAIARECSYWADRARASTILQARRQAARAVQAEEQLTTLALIFEGFGRLLATSSRDWSDYRVDAWLWAVVLGWDCEDPCHDDECKHDTLEQLARQFGWDGAAVAKARRYRAAVRALTEPKEPRP